MRRLPQLLLLPVLAIGLGTGCMKMHMDTVIENDGSGTCTVTYQLGRPVADAFEKMSAGGGGAMGLDEGPPQLEELTRAHMEELCRESGVKVLDHRFADGADGVSLTMKLGFPDVASLSSVMNELNGGSDEQEVLGIFMTDDGNYVLKSVPVLGQATAEADDGDEDVAAEAGDPAEMAEAMQQMSVLMAHLGDLDMRLTFTVPGDVIHSNAMEVEGRTSIWAVNAANMMEAGESDMKPEIRFSSKGLDLKTTKP